ncbi:hypothetical protein PHLGIDRAFT_117737 [Phlebiopsis gigantea 11061_1 CR5-6]|uniref:Uncharacterized protein n=1 Tax=Phlebiopsis gigantea (strain 11061_1 CR5-6) TaxID=745531 RepID=A0A0C3S902_PHLG1|nr:hypothetical protein PHLGIDRAFT_117737 [Phlebiopsis gigantea 11061_1 CR5-6]
MAVSAVYRDATRVCGLADFFAQVSRSTGDFGSDDLWGTSLVLRATPEYHARTVAENSGLVAQVLFEACLDMAEGADRTRRWTTEVLKVLHSAKAAMAEHGHNVSMSSHQAELEKAFVIAPQVFINDRASLNVPYRRLIALRLKFLLGSIDAAKRDLQSYRESQHLRAPEPRRNVQSSWFSSTRKAKNTAVATVADSDGPFDVVRSACVDANEVITGHADRYPQKKYHLSPSWSDVLTNPVALDEFIAILEWHQTVNDHDVQRFEASRANRTLVSLVKA